MSSRYYRSIAYFYKQFDFRSEYLDLGQQVLHL